MISPAASVLRAGERLVGSVLWFGLRRALGPGLRMSDETYEGVIAAVHEDGALTVTSVDNQTPGRMMFTTCPGNQGCGWSDDDGRHHVDECGFFDNLK